VSLHFVSLMLREDVGAMRRNNLRWSSTVQRTYLNGLDIESLASIISFSDLSALPY
jgi:hypothetical protein